MPAPAPQAYDTSGTAMIIDPFGRFLLASVVVSLAAACIVCAIVERPPRARLPRSLVLVAAGWSLVFVAAAVLVLVQLGNIGLFGLLLAAGEVMAAGAIWASRSPWGGRRDDGGEGPPHEPPELPPDYWLRWERSLREPPVGSDMG
jgi:predicted membrane channel-forming protein YqfA (hemolysin III family)